MHVGIIGGGPGGSVTAAMLAKLGHRVDLFETATFPRFRIGESLLPCNDPIFTDIGLDRSRIADQGFIPKLGAFFEEVGTGRAVRFPFSDGLPGDPRAIFQVERARFDHLLLQTAQGHGVQLHCPARIRRVDLDGERPVLHHDQGSLAVDFLVDASGREALVARQLGLIDLDCGWTRAAVYGHVPDLPLVPGATHGDVVISRSPDAWAWQIPLSPSRWSVGLVLPGETLVAGEDPRALFAAQLVRFPELAARLDGRLPDPVRATPSICYHVRQRRGRRWALVGDAGGFLDPILSAGVLLATRSGWRLARELHESGADADLAAWLERTGHDLTIFGHFIKLWYDGAFITRAFFGGDRDDDLHRGIVSLLAGNTTDLDNRFLALLARQDGTRRRLQPHVN